jgi:CheY-like chemotaxis protein
VNALVDPAADRGRAERREGADQGASSVAVPERGLHPRGVSTRVLIIEDDPDLREALCDLLRLDGFEVGQAANGLEGLARARVYRPSLILLDPAMPLMNGWEFLRERGSDPVISEIPVVVMSAEDREAIGWTPWVPKPYSADDVLHVVHRFAAGSLAASPPTAGP